MIIVSFQTVMAPVFIYVFFFPLALLVDLSSRKVPGLYILPNSKQFNKILRVFPQYLLVTANVVPSSPILLTLRRR
jgi:hypothetical protein